MKRVTLTLLMLAAALIATVANAQDPKVTGDQDGSSQQVEESDEAYRRRMELEDARYRDPTYTDPAGSWSRELEKIDTLPPESRENIRDQLVDVIMDNPDWKPGDALEEYPYEPTAAAQADADLLEREQAAWDEQIEKYHAREAEAFGAYRGPVAGPGNPSGESGGQQGQQGQQGEQGGGDGAQGGGQDDGQDGQNSSDQADRSAGTYQPQSDRQDEGPSTQGVSESALDFLMARQQGLGQSRQPPAGEPSTAPPNGDSAAPAGQQRPDSQSSSPAEPSQAEPSQAEPSQESEAELDMRGIIAIEDLGKLEGMGDGSARGTPPEQDPDENPENPRTPR
ncbi:MAG: hypothetical protein HKO85_06190 [Xanthomonadales bacterium]|nr:hypothetical protein [Gammaproteobacteria bacterium]MBT8055373.1 hypothetical protein [Gammaproteobacteria bacterium]NNJ79761.1 hypothetical protein [Xanthomonadales bacterium]NNL04859.1 hypothetical protein [Xanthomonadales bacterium]